MAKNTIIPRGIRNNNPLNIRIGNVWLGEVMFPTDPQFEQFVSMKYGLRAGFVLLRRYIWHYKRQTIAEIISAWAPSNENNTAKYIEVVCGLMNIQPNEKVDYADKATMCRLVQSMIVVECGRKLDDALIESSYDIA